MKTLKIFTVLTAALLFSFAGFSQSNCKGWGSGKDSTEAIKNHVLYRDYVKQKNYKEAFPLWEYVYKNAPAGSVKHFIDGVKIYKSFMEEAEDEAKKEEHKAMIYKLFDQRIECFGKEGAVLGRKAYNMFYMEGATKETYATFKKSMDMEGNKTKDFLMVPFASAAVDMFASEEIDKVEARSIHDKLMEIAEYNIANNEKSADKYTKAKDGIKEQFAVIERNIFDCDYFKEDIIARYKAEPNNPDVYRAVYKELKQVGCPDTEPVVAEIAAKDQSRVASAKAAFEAEQARIREENAPSANKAKAAYDEGNYAEAIRLYEQAATETNVDDKKGRYYYAIAQTCAYKTKSYSKAREFARKAAKYMPGSGKPYMLIGNIYASGASRCATKKDDWGSRLAYLAAIDKWSYAKSIDPNVAADASSKISKYAGYKPTKEQAFQRGLKDGQKANVGCWIGESVTVRTVKQY